MLPAPIYFAGVPAGREVSYKVEWEGVWAPFDLQEPNAEQLLSEAGE